MHWARRPQEPSRRAPRSEPFRSRDLVRKVREQLAPWLDQQGFRRDGGQAWLRDDGDVSVWIGIRCSQSGWDPHSGNKFVVELSQSQESNTGKQFRRSRIWGLLGVDQRREAIAIIQDVAATLPGPDQFMVSSLSAELKPMYLRQFAMSHLTPESFDVWFNYYDEDDAARWAEFLRRHIGDALEILTSEPFQG